MTMKNKITNLNELKEEIARLKNLKVEQEAYLGNQYGLLKEKINKPMHFFQNIFSFLPTSNILGKFGVKGGDGFHEDWLTKSLRVGLPFLINRIFFRKAGYMKRIIMGLLSSQAAGFLNKDRLASVVDNITSWIKKKPAHNNTARTKAGNMDNYDFGIPPDSETY